jgi:bifunctional DNA-binding transcriptional regulator/antitoxin component of YhaV-PrlF toxin-antitoxin module
MSSGKGPYADSRTVQESNGGYMVSIPKQIAERYDIEKGDEVWWTDDADDEGPEFIPPGEL